VILIIALLSWFFSYVGYAFYQHVAERVQFDLRMRYIDALLRQEVAFFERTSVEQIPAQIGENFFTLKDAIGEKFGNLIFATTSLFAGMIIAFSYGPEFAGACLAFFPFVLCCIIVISGLVKRAAIQRLVHIKRLGGIVEEGLFSVKLIISQKAELMISIFSAFFGLMIFGFYTYAFALATIFYEKGVVSSITGEVYTSGALLTVLVSMLTGFLNFLAVIPNIQAFTKAKVVGAQIFSTLERVPQIVDKEGALTGFSLTKSIDF
jgi:ATP-binding cassette subfamily B (MDR/TAP) protein 1